MAFLGIILMYFFILIAILVGLFVIGWILMIIGLANQKKVKLFGEKYPHVLISIGAVMVIIPMLCVGNVVVSNVVSKVKLQIQRNNYDNFVDKWENEYVMDDVAAREAVQWILDVADEGDKESLMEVFTTDIREHGELEMQIDEFLKEYPGGFSDLEFIYVGSYAPKNNRYTEEKRFYRTYEILKDGEYFYIDISACYDSDENPDLLGIESFIFKSGRAQVYSQDISKKPVIYDEYMCAVIDVSGDFVTRRVNGSLVKFYEIDRVLAQEEVIEAVNNSKDLDELIETLGEPNSINLSLEEVLYEIEPIDGKPRYAQIGYNDNKTLDGNVYIRE